MVKNCFLETLSPLLIVGISFHFVSLRFIHSTGAAGERARWGCDGAGCDVVVVVVWWCASDRAAREVMTDRNAKKQKQKVGYVVWLDSAQTRAQAQAQTRTHPAADEREGARWGRARHDERWYVWGSSLSIWPPLRSAGT